MPLYFAYGSNMDSAAMRRRCPRSEPVGPARLPRHRIALMREGFATVVRDPRRSVWGLLWEVPFADFPALDRYEEVAAGLYAKVSQPVVTGGGAKRALLYVGRNAGPGAPPPGYMDSVIAGARSAGLPEAYIAELSRLAAPDGRSTPAAPAPAVRSLAASPKVLAQPARAAWSWEP